MWSGLLSGSERLCNKQTAMCRRGSRCSRLLRPAPLVAPSTVNPSSTFILLAHAAVGLQDYCSGLCGMYHAPLGSTKRGGFLRAVVLSNNAARGVDVLWYQKQCRWYQKQCRLYDRAVGIRTKRQQNWLELCCALQCIFLEGNAHCSQCVLQ